MYIWLHCVITAILQITIITMNYAIYDNSFMKNSIIDNYLSYITHDNTNNL